MNKQELDKLVESGEIDKFTHPDLPLYGFNYSFIVQMNRSWNPITLQCRGLILDEDYNVVGRPFKKFFNYEEHFGPLPTGPYDVWEKIDGSLIIVTWYEGKLVVSTRGSFTSDQSTWARELLETVYSEQVTKLDRDFTYLFELIHPDNRIVVNYGGIKELRLIGIIHTKEGWEIQPSTEVYGFKIPEFLGTFGQEDSPLNLRFLEESNREGFVLRWHSDNLRLKLKFYEYVRLHKVLSHHNTVSIWEAMRFENDEGLMRLLEHLPDEYYVDAKRWVDRISAKFSEVDKAAQACYNKVKDLPSRREIALSIQDFEYKSLVFALLDNKSNYRDIVYKAIQPPKYNLGMFGVREDLDNPLPY